MAKLQGHFLKHRESPEKATEFAKELLDQEYQIKDMSVYEWLRRLNMHKYAPKFKKEAGVSRVSDLKFINDGNLSSFGIELMLD